MIQHFAQSFRIAIEAIAHNKLRAVLTSLGIVFGVGSVIGMLAIGAGAREESLRFIEHGAAPIAARFRVCLAASVVALATAAIPAAPTPAWASAGISLSIFAVAAFSVNMYTLPLDAFGGARAAFAVSLLVASYGAVQALISPAFGKVIDLYGYAPLAIAASLAPLAACAVLWGTRSVE